MMIKNIRVLIAPLTLLIFLITTFFIISVNANPIPVYPEPELVFFSSNSAINIPIYWIFLVFILDFFIDILIVYTGIFLLDKDKLILNKDVLDFSKRTFLLAVAVISTVGLLSELIFGQSIGGLIIVLSLIFISFVLVSRYLLKLNWKNSNRMGLFAIVINIIAWAVVFSV